MPDLDATTSTLTPSPSRRHLDTLPHVTFEPLEYLREEDSHTYSVTTKEELLDWVKNGDQTYRDSLMPLDTRIRLLVPASNLSKPVPNPSRIDTSRKERNTPTASTHVLPPPPPLPSTTHHASNATTTTTRSCRNPPHHVNWHHHHHYRPPPMPATPPPHQSNLLHRAAINAAAPTPHATSPTLATPLPHQPDPPHCHPRHRSNSIALALTPIPLNRPGPTSSL
ncbi:hypothetical protein EDB85DRAFT_1896644 [Lactarius pseudohatsudake]|nr:hypothetical protein EDB85DRAFT_1896644 [Lactarius pseudohatsudake]